MPGGRDPDTITWAEIDELALLLFEADVQLDDASDAYDALPDADRTAYRGRAQHVLRSGQVRMGESSGNDRPTIDQARGALGWLLSHWFGDEGDTSGNMPGEYEYAREILGGRLVDELAAKLAGEVATQWGVRVGTVDGPCDDEWQARFVVAKHNSGPDDGFPTALLISRVACVGPWEVVT